MQLFRISTGSGPLPAFNLFIAQHCPFVTNCHILRRLLCYLDQIYSLKRRHNALKLHIDVCIRQLKSCQVYFDFVVEIVYKSPMVTLYITVDVFVVMLREVSQDRKNAQPAENVCLKDDIVCLMLMERLLLIVIWW